MVKKIRKGEHCRDRKGKFVPIPACTGRRAHRKKRR